MVLVGREYVSTNDMYQPIPKGRGKDKYGIPKGRRRATLRATNKLSSYKKWISKELSKLVTPEIVEYFKTRSDHILHKKGILGFDIEIHISMPKDKFGYKNGKLKRRDATNAIKATEDGFLEHMKLEDSYTGQCKVRKYFNNEGTWQIEFIMRPIPLWVERKIMNERLIRHRYPGGNIRTSEAGFSNWGDVSQEHN
ncbi:hypothetical protein SP15_083 [Bacillus phage SP-15]|uniref:Uncharacterized protein n=1 Tax=Bacillus phage SP-15 TaxID=1792032 RepID=A0A127AW85_9CAUD|nr:hypothetical protein SP15_083 [Bacillus phage SP-15]AMM44882.1 hypothetical protein SP15_083 [Bacillus phage SP-15]